MTLGKKALAAALGWSRNKLERRLRSDPGFPVAKIGDQSGGWEFDEADVRAHLAGAPEPAAPAPSAKARNQHAASLAPATRRTAHHEGEATARQRKDAADAALREDRLRKERGELIDRAEMRYLLSTTMIQLASDLDSLPETLVKVCDLPEAATPALRKAVDDARERMVRNLRPFLSPTSAIGHG